MTKPLTGIRIIELAGIGPGPYAGMLLADMGAEVIQVNRPAGAKGMATFPTVHDRSKTPIAVDLRKPEGVQLVLDLVAQSDGLIEGLRPGVTERLGIGPEACHAVNRKLVYGRMTGWGQSGPWAKTAGHDLNYISITGALAAMGKSGEPPRPPLNFVGDYGGGTLFLVSGMLAGFLQAERTGKGTVVDAAIIDGVNSMMGIIHTLAAMGQWSSDRDAHLLDGAMPYYRCYTCKDGKFIAVGCIEPQFFAEFLRLLEIDPAEFGSQHDKREHAAQIERLKVLFLTRDRDAWAALFDGSDACVSPVLDYTEAPNHPQNAARGGLKEVGPFVHPRAAPVFDGALDDPNGTLRSSNDARDEILDMLGYDAARIQALQDGGVIAT
jgi:alpha-methylacyl-CoA racemase